MTLRSLRALGLKKDFGAISEGTKTVLRGWARMGAAGSAERGAMPELPANDANGRE
jgi:hypothetical protein